MMLVLGAFSLTACSKTNIQTGCFVSGCSNAGVIKTDLTRVVPAHIRVVGDAPDIVKTNLESQRVAQVKERQK